MSGWRDASARIERLLRSSEITKVWSVVERLLARLRDPGEEIPLLIHAAVLAAQYGDEGRALRWIARQEKRWAAPERAGVYEAVRIAVHLASKSYSSAERRARAIDWRLVPSEAWVANIRLLLAVRNRQYDDVLRLLRRPSPCFASPPEYRAPYDRGNRLRILGLYFFGQGRWDRGMSYFQAALRELSRDPSIDARLKEVEILGSSGLAAYHGGRLAEAEDLLREAIDGADRFHHAFYRDSFRHGLALVWAERDDRAGAEKLLLDVVRASSRRTPRTAADDSLCVAALLAAAGIALDERDGDRASRQLRRAGKLLDARDHPRYRGHLHLARGRLEALGHMAGHAQRAFEHFDLAERYFRSLGDGDLVGLASVRLYRGRLHLKLGELRGALSQARRCGDAARESRFHPLQAACLLFKSQLLLEQEVPCPQALYEDVLANLGAIRMPETLFKVIANLYLYSWELDQHLEWTDYHFRQIQKMQEILEEETFKRLYRSHVVERIAQRVLAKTLGVPPSSLGPDRP